MNLFQVRYISRIGGGVTAKLGVMEVMKRLLGSELCMSYSLYGTEKMRTFSNTILYKCIIGTSA